MKPKTVLALLALAAVLVSLGLVVPAIGWLGALGIWLALFANNLCMIALTMPSKAVDPILDGIGETKISR